MGKKKKKNREVFLVVSSSDMIEYRCRDKGEAIAFALGRGIKKSSILKANDVVLPKCLTRMRYKLV